LAAGSGLVILSPLLLTIAAVIKCTSKGPILFRQQRTGLGGKPFTILKFRTMREGAEAEKAELLSLSEQDGPAFKMTADPRITNIGGVLRRTSMDELPQLWNVLCGDMTLVGPRPLPCEETASCSNWQRRRLDVTPGLTCTWQVSGRSTVSFSEWMRLDLDYIQRRTVSGDLSLIVRTIQVVFKGTGR
jgi:lipopolysaccharide/colanic/teichoic acid biosynthesis glycosyltransferase